jgi:hypothetical protein
MAPAQSLLVERKQALVSTPLPLPCYPKSTQVIPEWRRLQIGPSKAIPSGPRPRALFAWMGRDWRGLRRFCLNWRRFQRVFPFRFRAMSAIPAMMAIPAAPPPIGQLGFQSTYLGSPQIIPPSPRRRALFAWMGRDWRRLGTFVRFRHWPSSPSSVRKCP